MTGLRIAERRLLDTEDGLKWVDEPLVLPTDFATKATAILAQRRKGKSYTADVVAEECVAAGIPFAIIDPTGAHWGLRASADGESAGLPVVILGGEHGDLDIGASDGAFIADLVLDHPGHYVIDVSAIESKTAEREFVTDFAERLYRRKGQPGMDFVFLLIVDEADMFVPQRHGNDENRMVGAFEAIVRRGGIRGLGVILISQRAAIVNKNVLEQIDVLIVLRVVGPNDQSAVGDYIKANASPEELKRVLGSLASLGIGQGWFYEPGEDLLVLIQVRPRRTFNSGATPKPGETRVEPRRLADVDLAALRAAMEDARPQPEETPEPKQAARRGDGDPKLRSELAEAHAAVDRERRRADSVVQAAASITRDALAAVDETLARLRDVAEGLAGLSAVQGQPAPAPPVTAAPEPQPDPPADSARHARSPKRGGDSKQRILNALAWFTAHRMPAVRREQAALFAGLSASGGATNRAFAALHDSGLVDYPKGGRVALTAAGQDAADGPPPVTSVAGLHQALYMKLDEDARARILRAAISAYPAPVTRDKAADAAGISRTGGATNRAFASLKDLGLIEYPAPGKIAATPVLFFED